MKSTLTVELLVEEAKDFARCESQHREPSLFGVTDGKAVGTYLEHKFQNHLQDKYAYVKGSSAKGIDFPKLNIAIKVTSIRQPQSSCPFKSARQKVTDWDTPCWCSFIPRKTTRRVAPPPSTSTTLFS